MSKKLSTTPVRLGVLAAILAGAFAAANFTGCGSNTPAAPIDVRLDLDNISDEELCQHLDHVIEFAFRKRRLSTRDQAAWQIIHAVIPFGRDLLIYDDQGRVVRAVDFVLDGGQMKGWTLLPGSNLADGRRGVNAILEEGTSSGQGHKDQWLGYMAVSCGLDPSRTVKVRGESHTIADWVDQIKLDIHDGTERGWSLMALATYLSTNTGWTAGDGQKWSLDRIMAAESATTFPGGSCGGTHALGGMSIALNRYIAETGAKIVTEGELAGKLVDKNGKLVTGGFAAANDRIQTAIRLAREYQQPDGSFSAGYLEQAEHTRDMADRMRKTGHVLEFLCLALSDEELDQPWVRRAAVHLVDVLERTESVALECGALYHAMSGLVYYRRRMFDERFGKLDFNHWAEEEIAAGNAKPGEKASEKTNDATPETEKKDDKNPPAVRQASLDAKE